MDSDLRNYAEDRIELLLDKWHIWLDLVLEAGISNMPSVVTHKIELWANNAELIGFNKQAMMCREFLSNSHSMALKADIFYKLISQYEVIKRLYENDKVTEFYANRAAIDD